MKINHNVTALNTYRQYNTANNAQTKSMEKLSSGLRINKAGDDAAGLAISEKMRSQIRGLNQASNNAQDGISMIQTAEGALNETHDILQRMRELATQSANDTNTTDDRKEIQKEINQLTSEVNRIGNTTEFNTKKLLNGDVKGSSGTGSANASASFDFNVTTGTSGSTTLNIGGTDYTINFQNDANYATSPTTFDATTKTINVKTGTGGAPTTPNALELADDLVKAFKDMRGADTNLSLKEFDFTNNLGKLEVTAKATGNYAGSAGKDSISFKGGRSVTVSDIVEGTNGSEGAAQLQIGANKGQGFVLSINDMRASSLGIAGTAGETANGVTNIEGGVTNGSVGAVFTSTDTVSNGTTDATNEAALDVSTHDNATKAIDVLDLAIKNVSAERSKLGASQNRLEHTVNNLSTSSENLTAAESRIRDVDYALAA